MLCPWLSPNLVLALTRGRASAAFVFVSSFLELCTEFALAIWWCRIGRAYFRRCQTGRDVRPVVRSTAVPAFYTTVPGTRKRRFFRQYVREYKDCLIYFFILIPKRYLIQLPLYSRTEWYDGRLGMKFVNLSIFNTKAIPIRVDSAFPLYIRTFILQTADLERIFVPTYQPNPILWTLRSYVAHVHLIYEAVRRSVMPICTYRV